MVHMVSTNMANYGSCRVAANDVLSSIAAEIECEEARSACAEVAHKPLQLRYASSAICIASFILIAMLVCLQEMGVQRSISNSKILTLSKDDHPKHHIPSPCDCTTDKPCKSLLLLRHAKSSWKNSNEIDDFDRHLSSKGRRLAHNVGNSLRKLNVDFPDVVLSSPSVRTRETLDIVYDGWLGLRGGKNYLRQHYHYLHEKQLTIYDQALYDLSYVGYLNHLIDVLSEHDDNEQNKWSRVLVVGHNPAMENLLHDLLEHPSTDSFESRHFSPGSLYVLCFPNTTQWGGDIMYNGKLRLHVPLDEG